MGINSYFQNISINLQIMAAQRYIYVQGMQEGLASYHLSENAGCWISYSNCPWTLDDGSKPPEKKFFTNENFNIAERTFSGTIEWGSTPFGGDKQWVYNFTLAEDYQTIESGTVDTTSTSDVTRTINFNIHLFYSLLKIEPCDDSSAGAAA